MIKGRRKNKRKTKKLVAFCFLLSFYMRSWRRLWNERMMRWIDTPAAALAKPHRLQAGRFGCCCVLRCSEYFPRLCKWILEWVANPIGPLNQWHLRCVWMHSLSRPFSLCFCWPTEIESEEKRRASHNVCFLTRHFDSPLSGRPPSLYSQIKMGAGAHYKARHPRVIFSSFYFYFYFIFIFFR